MLQLLSDYWVLFLWGAITIATWNGFLGGDMASWEDDKKDFYENPAGAIGKWLSAYILVAIFSPIFFIGLFCKESGWYPYESLIKIKHLKMLLMFSPVLCLLLCWVME